MDLENVDQSKRCHLVALPYPGRGHINPMLNICNIISFKRPDILITFVVTEEWLGFLSSERTDTKLGNLRFRTIPNVIPSEVGRGADFAGFIEATLTKLEAPVNQLLDRLETPASVILYDSYLSWVVRLGNRRNIPLASLFPMSATVFSMNYYYDLLLQNGHVPVKNLSDKVNERVDCIPGVSPTRIADFPTPFYGGGREVWHRSLEAVSLVTKAQYLLFASIYELEDKVIDALKAKLPVPVYSIGAAIPYFRIGDDFSPISSSDSPDYVKWLDSQPEASVLYISQGSFLSVTSAQLDEIVAGVRDSGVRHLWVARADAFRFNGGGDTGLVVPWCDQLKVLCHPSVGGFWSHCGWNSTKEGVFAGVPIMGFPIFWDQVTNSKMIVEDWKVGLRVRREDESLVTREEIAGLVRRLMDLKSEEGKEMRRRSKELRDICRRSTAEGGRSEVEIAAFVEDISRCRSRTHLGW